MNYSKVSTHITEAQLKVQYVRATGPYLASVLIFVRQL